MGDQLQPAPCLPRSEAELWLAGWIKRRQQVIVMQTAERNRQHQADPVLRASHARIIALLQRERARIEQAITRQLARLPTLQRRADLLCSIPSIAGVISTTLLATLPELGQTSHRVLSALVGLAPWACESGAWRGQPHIHGGRAIPSTALYQAVLSGIRCNRVIRHLYARLKARGKPSKVAMIACARHLLRQINAMLRDNQPWTVQPKHA